MRKFRVKPNRHVAFGGQIFEAGNVVADERLARHPDFEELVDVEVVEMSPITARRDWKAIVVEASEESEPLRKADSNLTPTPYPWSLDDPNSADYIPPETVIEGSTTVVSVITGTTNTPSETFTVVATEPAPGEPVVVVPASETTPENSAKLPRKGKKSKQQG